MGGFLTLEYNGRSTQLTSKHLCLPADYGKKGKQEQFATVIVGQADHLYRATSGGGPPSSSSAESLNNSDIGGANGPPDDTSYYAYDPHNINNFNFGDEDHDGYGANAISEKWKQTTRHNVNSLGSEQSQSETSMASSNASPNGANYKRSSGGGSAAVLEPPITGPGQIFKEHFPKTFKAVVQTGSASGSMTSPGGAGVPASGAPAGGPQLLSPNNVAHGGNPNQTMSPGTQQLPASMRGGSASGSPPHHLGGAGGPRGGGGVHPLPFAGPRGGGGPNSVIAGLPGDYRMKVIFGSVDCVERFAGLTNKMQAFRSFLENYPQHHKKFLLLQYLYLPPPQTFDDTQQLRQEVCGMANDINERFGYHIHLHIAHEVNDSAVFSVLDRNRKNLLVRKLQYVVVGLLGLGRYYYIY